MIPNILFFELLQVAVGKRQRLSCTPSEEEWDGIYDMAKRQAVVGICFGGMKSLPLEQLPTGRFIRQWGAKANKIEERNRQVSRDTRLVYERFVKDGFDAIILKGQGNMANYPENLRGLRTPGDIDIWVKPKNDSSMVRNSASATNHPVRTVIEYCQQEAKGEYVYYHNLDFPIMAKTDVEVHYRPTWLFCPWKNHTLQKWIADQWNGSPRCGSSIYDGYEIPGSEFNVIFQLLHIYKHMFEEGIGLRQLLDYYYVLESHLCNNGAQQPLIILQRLGIEKFTGAVMYVLLKVFALDRQHMLCTPNEKEGERLLSEIMAAGNFGHHDERYDFAGATNGSMQFRGRKYAWMRLRRNLTFLLNYPSEVIFEPPFRLYHWMWRTFSLWRWE